MDLSVIIVLTIVLIIIGALLNVLSDLVADEVRHLPFLTGRRVVLIFGALVVLLSVVTIYQFFVATPERASTSSVTSTGTPIQILITPSVPPDPTVTIIQPYSTATETAISLSPTMPLPASTPTRMPVTTPTLPPRSSPPMGISQTGIRILNFFGAPILLTINGRAYKIDPSVDQPFQIELLPGTYPYSANVLDPRRGAAHNQVTVKAGQWTDLTFVSAPD